MTSPPVRGGRERGVSGSQPGRVYGLTDDDLAFSSSAGEARTLRLRVLSASGLMKKDIFGASDPYVRMDLINAEDGSQADTAW